MPQRKIKAILFDAAGTLLHVEPSVGAVYAAVAQRHGVIASVQQLDAAFNTAWHERQPSRVSPAFISSEANERTWWRELVVEVFNTTTANSKFRDGFDAFFDELYERFAQPDVWRFYDDVKPALGMLEERGLMLGIVSNWDARLHRLLAASGLEKRFDLVLTSADVGRRKPDPLPFQQALERLGIAAHQAIYVGDSYEHDVEGAQGVGLRCMLIDREGRNNTPVETIQRLTDLPRLL